MPCVSRVADHPINHSGESESGVPDLQEHVGGEEHVAEVEPELGERSGDENWTVALPDVRLGVAGLAVGVAAHVGVERAQHAVRVHAEEAPTGECRLDRSDRGVSADEVDGVAELRGIRAPLEPPIEPRLVVPHREPHRVGHHLKRVPQRRGRYNAGDPAALY